jgi:iron complex outermembrane recepter protein
MGSAAYQHLNRDEGIMKKIAPIAAVLAIASLAPATTWAADAAASAAANDLDEVIVTGTRTKGRTVLDSPVPVDVLAAGDLAKSGATAGELGQALQALAPSFNFPRQSNSGGADHVRAAQLRGMSPDQVLVLVNGKRRHTSAVVNLESKIGKGTTPVDFNAIPLNAIKRIEVLRDGAGAQYGSDAIAGVINIILEDAPSGNEFTLSFGQNRTSFEPTHQSLRDGDTTVAQLKSVFALGSGHINVGGELRHRGRTNRSGFDTLPFFFDSTPANMATIGQRNYAPGDGDAKDYDLWFNSTLPLASGAEFYAFSTYDHRDSTGAAFFRYPDSSSNQTRIYAQGFRPESLGTNDDLSLAGGFKGQAGAWGWDGSLTYGQNRFNYKLGNSLNASLGPTSPTSFKIGDFKFEQLTANFDATRELNVTALSHPLNLAAGAEFRRERYQTGPGDPASYAAGPFTDKDAGAQAGPGLTPADVAHTSRNVGSLYVDLSSDLSAHFFADAALRYEHYSDFGDAVAGKLSGLFKVTPAFAFRGALSNSFRAPALSQTAYKSTSTSFGEGGSLATVLTLPVADPIAHALGAQKLKAEKSLNYSVGFTFAPMDGFNMAVDWFGIKVKDRITISERLGGSDLTSFIQTQFGLNGVEGINFFTNAVDTITKGVDVVANYRQELGSSALRLTAAYSYARTTIHRVRATPTQLQALGLNDVLFGVEERNTLVGAAPRNKTILSGEWSDPRWALTARLTRYGTAVRVFNFGDGFEPSQQYGAKTQLDLDAELKLTTQFSLALGGTNVLDNYADLSSSDINYFGNFPYDVLSPIGFNGAFFYARATAKF